MKLKNNKGFTIIELIVVIAILGILVLLAMSGYKGYVEKAKLVQIKHDVKAAEQLLAREYLAKNTSLPDNWMSTNPQNSVNNIYDTSGPVDPGNVEPGDYKLFPKDEIGSKLPGDFHAKDDGKVYYEDKTSSGDSESEDDFYVEQPPLTEDEINDLISQGYIPVASADELQQINDTSDDLKTWGAGTDYETSHIGGLDQKYIQVRDIDLSSYDNWIPIGLNPGVPFEGEYNGGNYLIDNLNIEDSNGDVELYSAGLFGSIAGKNVAFKNIKMNNVQINVDNVAAPAASALIGDAGDGSESAALILENIEIANSEIILSSNNPRSSIGGLIGIVSHSDSTINIYNVLYEGEVMGYRSGGLIGSIVDGNVSTTIEKAHIVSDLSGDYTGGLVGFSIAPLNFNNVLYEGEVIGYNSGGLIGSLSSGGITTIKKARLIPKTSGYYTGGLIGQATDPLIINDISIEASSELGSAISGNYPGGLIGSHHASNLSSISNVKLNMNVSGNSAGGLIGYSTTIMNIDNINFIGEISGSYAGGLVGEYHASNLSSISNVKLNINVSGGSAGGLVGYSTTIMDINNINFIGEIGGGNYVGGLVGEYYANSATISNIEIKTDMTGAMTGGLFGHNTAKMNIENITIRNSGIIGYVNAGGIAGVAVNTNLEDIHIVNSNIVGEGNTGGLFGTIYENTKLVNINIDANSSVMGSGKIQEGWSNQGTGGLIGHVRGTWDVNNVNIKASINGIDNVGELFGVLYYEDSTPIPEYDFTGELTGTGQNIGGPIGSRMNMIN